MNSEEEKKKYWTDQIKTMLGPCMITFAIPMLVPGFTITFVAFADGDAFPRYGALHIVGILILGLAIVLIILGCIFRIYWRPFIGPDLEKHLSPTASFRNLHHGRRSSVNTRTEKIITETPATYIPPSRRNSLQEQTRARMDNIPVHHINEKKKDQKSESEETEATGSESEVRKSLTGISRQFDIMASPRSRNMVPVHSDSLDDPDQSEVDKNELQGAESYEALQEFRKKRRRKAKKRLKQSIEIIEDENQQIHEDKKIQSGDKDPEIVPRQQKRRKKKKKKVLNALRKEEVNTRGDNGHFISPEGESNVPDLDIFQHRSEERDSDHSSTSLRSADSVLAQYTSRSNVNNNIDDTIQNMGT